MALLSGGSVADHAVMANAEAASRPRLLDAGRAAGLLIFASVSLASYLGGLWVLFELHTRYPALRPFMFSGAAREGPSWLLAALSPLGALALMITALLIEVSVIGFERSGLRRLLQSDASARVDLFYVGLRLSGGLQLLAFVFSLGTLYYAANGVHRYFGFAVLSSIDSVVVQFVVVYLVNTLVFYLAHRLMHTRWLWEVHKVHHSATDLNVITAVRNHPIDFAIMTVVNAFPAALLGAEPVVVVVYYLANGLYQLAVHSELPLTGRVIDAIWITPAAHRVHHSSREEHWNRNFGILTMWDRLFGTYHPPHRGPLQYGVDGAALINRNGHAREVFALVWRWLLGRSERQR